MCTYWVTGSVIETPDGLLQVGKDFKIGTGQVANTKSHL